MAEISQIKLPDNTVLDLKDATARNSLSDYVKKLVGTTNTKISIQQKGYSSSGTEGTYLYAGPSTNTSGLSNKDGLYIEDSYERSTHKTYINILGASVNIEGIITPTADTMAANKKYVDDNTPSPESMSNVQAMLTELGLDPNASLTPATVPAETNHALVQEG